MSSTTVNPGEIKVMPTEDGGLAIVRNFGDDGIILALIHSKRKRNRLRIIISDWKEVYELNWRKMKISKKKGAVRK